MEWVKKPQITCEADKTWNSTVRGGGRTSLTWYDDGQEQEREGVKETTYELEVPHESLTKDIHTSHASCTLYALQKVAQEDTEAGRSGQDIVGLHLKVRVRVRVPAYTTGDYTVMVMQELPGPILTPGWNEEPPADYNERSGVFAAIVQDTQGDYYSQTAYKPEDIVKTSGEMNDSIRQLPRPTLNEGAESYKTNNQGWRLIAYDSWQPATRPAIRERTASRKGTSTTVEGITTSYDWDSAIQGCDQYPAEEHEFFFSIDLESPLHYKTATQWIQNTPTKNGLYLALWGGTQKRRDAGPADYVIGEMLEGQAQFHFEEILTEGQRRRALRDRILNAQREVGTHGKQTHQEQMDEEDQYIELDNPLHPEAREEYADDVEQTRGQRRERDELEEAEERPHSFRRTGGARDLEVLTGMSWNDEMESMGKRKK